MPTVAFVTLGCKVNQFDTQAIREAVEAQGLVEVDAHQDADVYVVNSCCVTRESHRKSLRQLRHLIREHPDAAVIAVGCSVDADAAAFQAVDGLSVAVGNAAKSRLAAIVAEALGLPTGEAEGPEWPSISTFAGHTRAFVKIEDGCDDFCAYCIVPHVRGRVRSRPPDQVVDEVARLVANGYREVVLTGIHLGCYGQESGGEWGLLPLVESLVETEGLRRLRLSSLELREVTDGLLDLMAASPVLCPHLHIPLQSGDDAILRAMNRRYAAADFLARVDAVRSRLNEPALTTDVIVGFPGETDAQFRHTVDVCRRAALTRMHVFPYSDREGTPAARMDGKLPKAVIDARRHELLAVAADLAAAYHRRFLGRDIEALVEGRRDRKTAKLCGYSPRYVRAFLDGPDALFGTLTRVRVERVIPRGVEARRHEGGGPQRKRRG